LIEQCRHVGSLSLRRQSSPLSRLLVAIVRLPAAAQSIASTFVWSLAKESGVAGLRYPGEDGVYEKPILDAAGL
jgi:hypothetical protein